MKKTLTALVLQGGGALGAYEYGVLSAIYERRGFQPSVVTGVSIGAINAAVLVGAKGEPMETLGELWRRLTLPSAPFLPHALQQSASVLGNPAMYTLRPEYVITPLLATSIYDTAPLYSLLEDLIDIDKLNNSPTAVVVTAVNIETGELMEFENRNGKRLEWQHIVASGSLPPGFPMTQFDGQSYWDGGLFSNTPLSFAINRLEQLGTAEGDVERELIVVDLFPKKSKVPGNMMEVADRMTELLFANKLGLDRKFFHRVNVLIDVVKMIDKELPKSSPVRKTEGFQWMLRHQKIDRLTVIEHAEPETLGGASDFSRESIARRIEAGYRDAKKELVG